MPKYWGKQIFSLRSFPEVGQRQKTEKKERKNERRAKVGNNNGQLRIANATSGGARKATWAKRRAKVGNNNGKLRFATTPRMAHTKQSGPNIVPQ